MIAHILAKPVAWLLGLLALFLLVGFAVNRCTEARQAGAQVRVEREAGKARADSGKVAVDAVEGAAGRAAASDALTRETEHAIRSAGSPDAALSAALDGLCQRAAYRCSSDCLRRASASGVAKPGAGCATAP